MSNPLPDGNKPDVKVPVISQTDTAGLTDAGSAMDELTERKLDEIEMIGEETAAGYHSAKHSAVSAGMRYLHCSRTIHQLVTDRNRAVGIYLAVASLLWTASTALLNAKPSVTLIVPIETLQYWALPVTFGTLTLMGLFIAFLLIRTRIGLIYEVAKMNLLLGMPVGRVKRIGVLSIFFIMHLLVSLAGGGSALLFSYHLFNLDRVGERHGLAPSILIGFATSLFLVLLYIVTVLYTTADKKLSDAGK